MRRVLIAFLLAVVFGGALLAAGTYAVMPELTWSDLNEAWRTAPGHGRLHRVLAYPSALRGRADARRDLAEGRLELRLWGLPVLWRPIQMEMLRSRGVVSRTVAGCVLTYEQEAAWEGYNAVMAAEIERRYGRTFLDDTAAQARAEFERIRARSRP